MRADIIPGAIFPDYELTDHTAKRRKLSELQGRHPMVLVLSRGGGVAGVELATASEPPARQPRIWERRPSGVDPRHP